MRIDDQSEADPFGAQRAVLLQRCGERLAALQVCGVSFVGIRVEVFR